MSRAPIEFIRHILDETAYLIKASEHLTKEEFLLNEDLKRAFTRSIEIMGEASKNVPQYLRDKYPVVDWSGMARMRDKLIHHYFGVDYDLVWEVVDQEVPLVNEMLEKIIEQLID